MPEQLPQDEINALPQNVRHTLAAFTKLYEGAVARKDTYLIARIDEASAYVTVDVKDAEIQALRKELGERSLKSVEEANADEG